MGTKNKSPGSQFNPKGVVQGTTLVCHDSGDPVDCVLDDDGVRRLAVDSLVTIDAQNITVEVNLDSTTDAVRVEDPDTGAHIRVETDGSINVNTEVDASSGDSISIGAHPNQIFDETADTITTAAFEEIYSYTSTADNTRIVLVECTVSTPSILQLKINGAIKRVLRTSPTERNIRFDFSEHRKLTNGQTLSVEAKVERLIKASYSSFTALEGYLE